MNAAKNGFYARYGLPKVLNASGTLTMFGGCRVRPEAAKAMAEASAEFADLDRLLESSGLRIAGQLGVEGAVVTSGASPALILAAAACIAGKDPWLRNRLPASPPPRREVVIMRCHRNPYDNAIPTAGARFVEIGDSIKTHPWELEAAIGENTAAVFYALQAQMLQASLSLDETLSIAHAKNIPVIVDAAAELPPKRNLWELAQRGADLVAFSGGKEIAGPQSSGLLVGKAGLIEAARFNGAPFYGPGRPVKAGKENIAGFAAALEAYLAEDEDARMTTLGEIRDMWIGRFSGNPALEAGVFTPTQPGMHPVCIPKAFLRPRDAASRDPSWAESLATRLRRNNPSVIVDRWNGSIILNPQTLDMDEAILVAEHIEKALAP